MTRTWIQIQSIIPKKPGKPVCSAPTAASEDTDCKGASVLERSRRFHRPRADGPLREVFGKTQWRRILASLLSVLVVGPLSVAAQPTPNNSRGELLYSAHCGSCHTAEVHWREKKLATDWPSLRAQVLRWETNIGMNWTDDDIVAVARYLNEQYYRFPAADMRATVERLSPRASTP